MGQLFSPSEAFATDALDIFFAGESSGTTGSGGIDRAAVLEIRAASHDRGAAHCPQDGVSGVDVHIVEVQRCAGHRDDVLAARVDGALGDAHDAVADDEHIVGVDRVVARADGDVAAVYGAENPAMDGVVLRVQRDRAAGDRDGQSRRRQPPAAAERLRRLLAEALLFPDGGHRRTRRCQYLRQAERGDL